MATGALYTYLPIVSGRVLLRISKLCSVIRSVSSQSFNNNVHSDSFQSIGFFDCGTNIGDNINDGANDNTEDDDNDTNSENLNKSTFRCDDNKSFVGGNDKRSNVDFNADFNANKSDNDNNNTFERDGSSRI